MVENLGSIFYLAVLLFTGLVFSKIVGFVKLPDVTGYLIGGLIVGPSVLNIIPNDSLENMVLVSQIALGFIAFSIGSEFKMSYFKRVGLTPIVIAIFESLVAVCVVILGLLAIGCETPYSIVLGAIAAATAPAATIMVIKQYKAKGTVTETLLSVVALDDAVALIGFGIAVAVASNLTNATGSSFISALLSPILEIVLSAVIGIVCGLVLTYILRFFKGSNDRLCLNVAMVLTVTALSDLFHASALLSTMIAGAMVANFCKSSNKLFELNDKITPPIFMLFFVVSGAELNLSILPQIGLVGVIYVLMRVAGKLLGAFIGAKIMRCEDKICKWLGPTLIPQAGVAIGLTVIAKEVVPEHAQSIRAVILCSTLIYELVGPVISKWSLEKAGEIKTIQ